MTYSLKKINSAFKDLMDDKDGSTFLDYLSLKSIGYSRRYETPIMPLNQADYFSPIYILYKVVGGRSVPIMTQRYVSRRACLGYNLVFPIEGLVLESKCKESICVYNDFISGLELNRGDVIYPGSFTTNPNLSYSEAEKKLFVELTCAFHFVENLRSPDCSFVTTSVKRFKTYKVLEKAGHKLLNGLNAFRKESFYGEEVLLMGTDSLSSLCKENFYKHEDLFNEKAVEKLVA